MLTLLLIILFFLGSVRLVVKFTPKCEYILNKITFEKNAVYINFAFGLKM